MTTIKIDPFVRFELERNRPGTCEIATQIVPLNAWDLQEWYHDMFRTKGKPLFKDDGVTPDLDEAGAHKTGLTMAEIYAHLTAWVKEQTGVTLKEYEAKKIYEAWVAGDGTKDEQGREKNPFALFAKKNGSSPIQPETSGTLPDSLDPRFSD